MKKVILLLIVSLFFLFGCGKKEKEQTNEDKQYVITFNVLDELTTQNVKENEKVSKPVDPIKEGFIFDGWYLDTAYTSLYDFEEKVLSDFTLYAKFIEIVSATNIEIICNDYLLEGESLDIEFAFLPEGAITNINVEIIVGGNYYEVSIDNNKLYYDYNLYGKNDFEIYVKGDNNITQIKKISFISKETIMVVVDDGKVSDVLKYYYHEDENREFKYFEVSASETLNIYNNIYKDSYWYYGNIENVSYYFAEKYLTKDNKTELFCKFSYDNKDEKYFVMYIPRKYSDKDLTFVYEKNSIKVTLDDEFGGYLDVVQFDNQKLEKFLEYLNAAF